MVSENTCISLNFKCTKPCFLLCRYLCFGISVEDVKKAWKNIRDPYRKKELEIQTRGDTPSRGGKRKSGSGGTTVAEAVQRWKFYERMSF